MDQPDRVWLHFTPKGWDFIAWGRLVTLPFTAPADRVLHLAEQEADHFGHEYIGTEHLLLASVREDQSAAAAILRALGVNPGRVRRLTESVLMRGPPGERVVFGRLPYTPRANAALALAADEARGLGDGAVGPEHLLLGLVREGEGVAAHVLRGMGADHGVVREEILRRRLTPGEWRTEAVVALARGVSADGAYDRLPVLADALEDAGCADPGVLDHLRLGVAHGCRAPGCWVIDRLLGPDRAEVGGRTPPRVRPWWRFWG